VKVWLAEPGNCIPVAALITVPAGLAAPFAKVKFPATAFERLLAEVLTTCPLNCQVDPVGLWVTATPPTKQIHPDTFD